MKNYYFIDDDTFHSSYGNYEKTVDFCNELSEKFLGQNVQIGFINRFDKIHGNIKSFKIGEVVENPISGDHINDIVIQLDVGSFGVFSDLIEGLIFK